MQSLMEKEILSQKEIILNFKNKYVKNGDILFDYDDKVSQIVLVASGSSYNVSLLAKYFFMNIADILTSVEFASEILNSDFKNFNKDILYIFVSQSGNSADTFLAMEKIKASGAKCFAVTNNPDSKMDKIADYKINIEAGREFAIAATKTFSATVFALYLLSLKFAYNKNIDVAKKIKNLEFLDNDIDFNPQNIDEVVDIITSKNDFSISAFRNNYPIARECALKIKETCYINTSFYPTGEFIHGHFALLNKSNTFLTFVDSNFNEIEEKLLEKILTTYTTQSIVISDIEISDKLNFNNKIIFKKGQSEISEKLNMIFTVQLLALKCAYKLGHNIDNPEGLNKVVESVIDDK